MSASTGAVDKPFAPACERNRAPILQVLQPRLRAAATLLELGSGSGQHAVHFAAAMPWLQWQCSDRAEVLPGMRRWLDEAALPNTPAPLALDVAHDAWPTRRYEAVFTANTLHIMAWTQVQAVFAGIDQVLDEDGQLLVYGPFNRGGAFTSDSNRAFDAWLRARDPDAGLRDLEAVHALAQGIGLRLVDDLAMPAHNACLVWRR